MTTTSHPLYEHRQIGWAMVVLAFMPFVWMFLDWTFAPPAHRGLPIFFAPGLLAVCAVVVLGFSSLATCVTTAHVVLRFGIGFYRRSIPLETIAAVAVSRSRWYEGWGVHWTTRGMLYNVNGLDVVRIDLVSGKSLRIGSDEAKRLCAAIQRAIDTRRQRSGAVG